jgi:hypothetical protein
MTSHFDETGEFPAPPRFHNDEVFLELKHWTSTAVGVGEYVETRPERLLSASRPIVAGVSLGRRF